MRCEDLQLVDLVEGTLPAADRAAADSHLATCASCRALVADLRGIRAAAITLEPLTPPADAFARIQAALPPRTAPLVVWPAGRRARSTWLAAAASLLVATGIGVSMLVRSATSPVPSAGDAMSTAALVDSVQADLQVAESHYEKAIAGLEQIARSDTEMLEPQVAAVLRKNLQVLDQAIDESRAALRVEPASAPAQDGLFDAMRTKLALLQQTVELINEMRKGNQAEAGRLMQDLSR